MFNSIQHLSGAWVNPLHLSLDGDQRYLFCTFGNKFKFTTTSSIESINKLGFTLSESFLLLSHYHSAQKENIYWNLQLQP